LRRIQSAYPDWFTGIRQDGLVMGLEFGHPQGAKFVMKRLYEHGVWAIFSTLDPRVLQFKPGLLLTPDLCAELLDRVEVAIAAARDDASASPGGRPSALLPRGTTPGAPGPRESPARRDPPSAAPASPASGRWLRS
jgi:hypothetical protein